MTKNLRKAIMKRISYLKLTLRIENREIIQEDSLKREKRNYFSNLNMDNYTDNKNFWNTVKPLFSNYGGGGQK